MARRFGLTHRLGLIVAAWAMTSLLTAPWVACVAGMSRQSPDMAPCHDSGNRVKAAMDCCSFDAAPSQTLSISKTEPVRRPGTQVIPWDQPSFGSAVSAVLVSRLNRPPVDTSPPSTFAFSVLLI
jgi:hypothetical protein